MRVCGRITFNSSGLRFFYVLFDALSSPSFARLCFISYNVRVRSR